MIKKMCELANDYILSPENYKQAPLMKIEDLRNHFIFIKKSIYS